MNRTFNRETINDRQFNFLTLPNSGYFKFEIVNTMGAHVERIFQQMTGRNVYGLSHLVEHLGFRATKDYTTDELMDALKTEGKYNASTDHERINYWFKSTSDRAAKAINLVCNFALNDLTKLSKDEFQTEQRTVYNEVKRYHDDDQTMFHFAVMPTVCGYAPEDNILGTPETVDALTLEDAKLIKAIFLTQGEQVYNITYDPTQLDRATIVQMVEDELARFPNPKVQEMFEHIGMVYLENCKFPEFRDFTVDNESEQVMTALVFDAVDDNIVAARAGNQYLAHLSPTSLTDLIREKNGLTYGLYLYDDNMAYVPYVIFSCDVTKGTEDQMMELLKQSVNESVDNYTEETHNKLIDTLNLKRTLAFVDQEQYNSLFWLAIWFPDVFEHVSEFVVDVDKAFPLMGERLASYEAVLEYLEMFRDFVNTGSWAKLTNIEE